MRRVKPKRKQIIYLPSSAPALVTEMPALGEYERTMSVAVNADYSRMSASVSDGDEVAFLPPVSGG